MKKDCNSNFFAHNQQSLQLQISVKFPSGINASEYNIASNMPLKQNGEQKNETFISAAFQVSTNLQNLYK